jgi:hypothetical protein
MRTMLRGKVTLLIMMLGLLLAVPALALADTLSGDADADALASPAGNSSSHNQQPGTTVAYNFDAYIRDQGPDAKAVFINSGDNVKVSIARAGAWKDQTDAGSPANMTFTKYTAPAATSGGANDFTQSGTIRVTVPCGTPAGTQQTMTATLTGVAYDDGVDNLVGTADDVQLPSDRQLSGGGDITLSYVITAQGANAASCTPANNAPTVSTAAEDTNGIEGNTLSANGAFSDADGDTLSLDADEIEGTFTDNGDGTWSWELATTDDVAGGTITVTADDGNGGTVTDDFTYSAANADPSATFNAPDQADEGSNFTLSLDDVQDPGSADTHQYNFDCGDGSGFGGWDNASSVQCSAGDGPNTLTVKGQVRDDDEGLSAEYSHSVTVNNLPPTVTLSGPTSVNENNAGSENYTFTVSDPGGDTITSVSADCDADSGTDDGFLQGSQPTVSNKSFSCRFPDGLASALVKASATDDDGATGSDSKTVSIANVAPTLSNLQLTNATGTACIGGNTVSITYNVSDPGDDTFSLDPGVNWGDGTTNTASSHTYGAGAYTISVKGKDSDGTASNQLTSNTNAVSLLYKMSGILAPFNADGNSIWKYGSTIPVKVQITDCNNTPVQGLAPKLGTSLANAATPAVSINEDVFSTSGADTGNVLRYSDGQYIYNFNSKSAAITDQNATYWMSVKGFNAAGQVVTDPAQVNQKFGIKSK